MFEDYEWGGKKYRFGTKILGSRGPDGRKTGVSLTIRLASQRPVESVHERDWPAIFPSDADALATAKAAAIEWIQSQPSEGDPQ